MSARLILWRNPDLPQGLKISLTLEETGCRTHRSQLEIARNLPRRRSNQRIHRGVIPHKVSVLFASSIEAGMETFRRNGRSHNSDVLRQPRIQRQG